MTDALTPNPHALTNTSTHAQVEAELYMTRLLTVDHADCQFLKEIKMTLIVFI